MPPQPEPVVTGHVFNQPSTDLSVTKSANAPARPLLKHLQSRRGQEMALIRALDRHVPQTPEPIWKESSLLSDDPQTNTKHSPYAA